MAQITQSESEQGLLDDKALEEILNSVEQSSALNPVSNDPQNDFHVVKLNNINEMKKKSIHLYNANRFQEALEVIEDAIRLLPGDLELNFFEAQCLYRLNELDRSEIILKNLLNLDDNHFFLPLPRLYALVLLKSEKYSKAETMILSMLNDYGKDMQLQNMLGYALERQDKLDEAENIFNEVLTEDENNANANNSMAYLYYRKKLDLNAAMEMIQKSLIQEPDNPSFMDTHGMILFGMGEKEEGLKILKKAQSLDPKNPIILQHLSEVMEG